MVSSNNQREIFLVKYNNVQKFVRTWSLKALLSEGRLHERAGCVVSADVDTNLGHELMVVWRKRCWCCWWWLFLHHDQRKLATNKRIHHHPPTTILIVFESEIRYFYDAWIVVCMCMHQNQKKILPKPGTLEISSGLIYSIHSFCFPLTMVVNQESCFPMFSPAATVSPSAPVYLWRHLPE